MWHIRYKQKDAAFQLIDAKQLTDECLRFMYRLLFLFYIEARPELNYIPVGSEVYRQGYSLERLREMEHVQLIGEEERDSTYIHDSLERLFRMIWRAIPSERRYSCRARSASWREKMVITTASGSHR